MNTLKPTSPQNPNNKKLVTYKFECLACKHNWSFESENANVNEVFPNFCPNCGTEKAKGKLQWVFVPPSKVSTVENQRRANRAATIEAARMAGEYERVTPKEEMVTVRGTPSKYIPSGEVQVPKKTLDSLSEAIIDSGE
jgi:hypothetical protein